MPLTAHKKNSLTELQGISSAHWWQRMSLLYCHSCEKCEKMQRNGQTPDTSIQTGYTTFTHFERVWIDLITPPPTISWTINSYILTLIDSATRWPYVIPKSYIDSESICEVLLELFARFYFPECILSDNGPQYVSNLTSQVNKLLGVVLFILPPKFQTLWKMQWYV